MSTKEANTLAIIESASTESLRACINGYSNLLYNDAAGTIVEMASAEIAKRTEKVGRS